MENLTFVKNTSIDNAAYDEYAFYDPEGTVRPKQQDKRLGTFLGCTVPVLQNIVGIIVFLRLPWAIGQVRWFDDKRSHRSAVNIGTTRRAGRTYRRDSIFLRWKPNVQHDCPFSFCPRDKRSNASRWNIFYSLTYSRPRLWYVATPQYPNIISFSADIASNVL